MKILVTGVAGIIGSKLSEEPLARGDDVVGIDIMNDYYDVRLKEARLKRIEDSLLAEDSPKQVPSVLSNLIWRTEKVWKSCLLTNNLIK